MARARSGLLAAAFLAVVGLLALHGAPEAFVSAPASQSQAEVSLRGAPAAMAAAAAAGLPLAASAVPDEYLNYNFAGEYTPFMTIGYFGLTSFLTAFCFLSYLILTKLKII
eukprot:TRINITY_DN1103_c0_g1_i2.p1 TRINITY_DN1103_c0_g1~~TRINITY_DN1103_c0_g1_i2.p1  ORF type:complete len:111 (+),score=31.68 TRINITY_DN1103_c0_g1_i2:79-411(+)